jgi:hypothetical protein
MRVHARSRMLIALLCSLALAAVVPAAVGSVAQPAVAAEPGPPWITPHNGDTIPFPNDLYFQVGAIPRSVGYLYGFFENGTAVWENWANEHHLDGTTYPLPLGSPGHRALGSGARGQVSWPLQIWVRGYIDDGGGNYHWSDADIINVTLVGFGCIYDPATGGCNL